MVDRTITLRGPFSDDDITAYWRLMQSMEAKNPDARYSMVIDAKADDATEAAMEALQRIAPVAEGYARVIGISKPDRGKCE